MPTHKKDMKKKIKTFKEKVDGANAPDFKVIKNDPGFLVIQMKPEGVGKLHDILSEVFGEDGDDFTGR